MTRQQAKALARRIQQIGWSSMTEPLPHVVEEGADLILAAFSCRKEERANWQCSGCRWGFQGDWQKVCPVCGRIDYWTGSVQPGAKIWRAGEPACPTGPGAMKCVVGVDLAAPGARDESWEVISRKLPDGRIVIEDMGRVVDAAPSSRSNVNYGEVWLRRYDEYVQRGFNPREVVVAACEELNRGLGMVQRYLEVHPGTIAYTSGTPKDRKG